MFYDTQRYIVGVLLLLNFAMACKRCEWSHKSLTTTNSCPETKSEQQTRAEIKDCTSLASKQNCTEPSKFKYHCVPDELMNTFIEVCAQEIEIVGGFCTEYNIYGMVIQEHRPLKCSDQDPSCPSTYLSTDAYKYKGCYDAVKSRKCPSCTSTTTNTNRKMEKTEQHAGSDFPIPKVPFAIFFSNIPTIAILGAIIIFRNKISECLKSLLRGRRRFQERQEKKRLRQDVEAN